MQTWSSRDWSRTFRRSAAAGDGGGKSRPGFFIRPTVFVALGIFAGLAATSEALAQEAAVEAHQKGLRLQVPESVSLAVLVDLVSEHLGINVLYDEALAKQMVHVRAPALLSEEGLMALLESALRFRGFALVQGAEDGWMEVVPVEEARLRGAPLVLPEEPIGPLSPYGVVTQAFRLEHGVPEQLAPLVQSFLSRPGGNLQIVSQEGLVVVSDRWANVRQIEEVLELVDRPPAEVVLEPVAVEHGSASRIATEVTQLLQQKSRLEAARPGAEAEPPVHLVAQEEARQILVLASPPRLAEVRDLIATFDVPGQAVVTRVYEPLHVPAEQLRRGVQQLLAAQPADAGPAAGLRLVVPEGREFLITIGPQAAQRTFEDLAGLLDRPLPEGALAEQRGQLRLYTLKNVNAADIAVTLGELLGLPVTPVRRDGEAGYRPAPGLRVVPGALPSEHVPPGPGGSVPPPPPPSRTLEQRLPPDLLMQLGEQPEATRPERPTPTTARGSVRITVEPGRNALLVNAPPELHEEIGRLLGLLDVRPPQVMLEAIVVEITSTHNFQLGVELESVERFAGSGVGSLIFTQFGLSTVDPATAAKVLNPALGFNTALVRPEEVPLIVQALEQETDARIVSAPRILVNDNQQAVLSRVDEEPFTSTNFREELVTTSFSGFAQAGTTLSIVPHIGEADHLLLEYEVQVNNFRGTAAQAGVPPARTTNLAQSSVTIPDGWAIVVGGLVDERDDFVEDRVPLVGRLPVIGIAFRNTTKANRRKTLFVFLRAKILRHEGFADLKHLSRFDEAEAGLPPERPPKHPPILHPGGPLPWTPQPNPPRNNP